MNPKFYDAFSAMTFVPYLLVLMFGADGWALGLMAMTALTIAIYQVDKSRGQQRKTRIPGRVLLILGVAGGATGAFIARKIMRHASPQVSAVRLNQAALAGNVLTWALAGWVVASSLR